ncbi:helix-turn-helix domain-containing protein [Paraburkholderia sp. DGU8]|uniref:helix-turn-helix domain-containing protein n=1 Tax=Paraburkholderia sp. DGU8 TaxID=3161997 RepID=UPI003465A1B3
MSWQATKWALEQQIVEDSTARHVLVCLAHYAGDQGKNAFPSTATLVKISGLSERTVRLKLDLLETAGAIVRGDQAIAAAHIDRVDRRPVCYDLCMQRPANLAPREEERGATGAPRSAITGCSTRRNGVQMTTERGATAAPKQSYKPSTDYSCAPRSAKRSGPRASRLSEDWVLPENYERWALEDEDINRTNRWTADHVHLVAQRFRDYWIAQPGRKGVKLDWFATWRNRCRDPKAAMPTARNGRDGAWWLSPETARAKAHEVGVGDAKPGESDAMWRARIQGAIDNGGKPPAPRPMPVTPLDPVPTACCAAERGSERSRAATSELKALLRQRSAGGTVAP